MSDPRQRGPFDQRRPADKDGSHLPGGGANMPGGGRLAIIQLVKMSLQSLWLCRDDALRLGIIPVALYFIAMLFGQSALQAMLENMSGVQQGTAQLDPAIGGSLLLTGLVMFVSLSLMAVNWLRFLLLGSQAVPGIGVTLGRHHLLFLLGAFALSFSVLIALTLLSFPLRLLLQNLSAYALWVCGLVVGSVAIRLALSLVGLAINQPLGPRQAWEASRHQGIVLLVAFLLVQAPFVLVMVVIGLIAGVAHLDTAAPYSLLLVESLVQVCATMAQCGVLAGAYRRLIGIRA